MTQRSRNRKKTGQLFRRTIKKALAIQDEITVSQWAERYRVLDESSNLSGKWSNAVTPYLVGIMDAFNDPRIREIYLCKGSQLGGTEALINMLGYIICEEPGPALIVYPNISSSSSIFPLLHATSMAWRIALSTLLEVVLYFCAIVGYSSFVM